MEASRKRFKTGLEEQENEGQCSLLAAFGCLAQPEGDNQVEMKANSFDSASFHNYDSDQENLGRA